MNKRSIGRWYEDIAADWLLKNGFRILARNFRSRQGEIDIICLQGSCGFNECSPLEKQEDILVFVEVKYRSSAASGRPEEALTPAKIRTISRVADYYRVRYRIPQNMPCRFDVIAIEKDRLRHYENAFPYMQRV